MPSMPCSTWINLELALLYVGMNQLVHISFLLFCCEAEHLLIGKTSLLECLIGCRLGYSDAGRATVCPVIYTFLYREGEEGFYQHGMLQLTSI